MKQNNFTTLVPTIASVLRLPDSVFVCEKLPSKATQEVQPFFNVSSTVPGVLMEVKLLEGKLQYLA